MLCTVVMRGYCSSYQVVAIGTGSSCQQISKDIGSSCQVDARAHSYIMLVCVVYLRSWHFRRGNLSTVCTLYNVHKYCSRIILFKALK